MTRPTKHERLELEALYEAFLRAWEELRDDRKVGYADLCREGGLSSKGPLWALFNRKPSGGPSREAIVRMAQYLEINSRELQQTAKRLAQRRRDMPLWFKDGALPRSVGDISPLSFIVEKGFATLKSLTRGDLLSAGERQEFPYELKLLEQDLTSHFAIVPDQVLRHLLVPVAADEVQTQIYCTRLSTLRKSEVERQGSLVVLNNWTYRMSPDFAIIARDTKGRRGDGSDSLLQRLTVELDSFDDALLEVCQKEIQGRTLVCSSAESSSTHNLILLLSTLGFRLDGLAEAPAKLNSRWVAHLDTGSIVRFALHHLHSGHFGENIVVLGGAPHYWAARWASNLDVILTDEDMFGVAKPFEHLMTDSDRKFRRLRLRSNWAKNNSSILDDLGREKQSWRVEDRVLGFRTTLDKTDLQVCAHYFRSRFGATKLKREQHEFKDIFAKAILDGYEEWGGIGVPFDVRGMDEFIEEGMHLFEGDLDPAVHQEFSSPADWVSPLHTSWFSDRLSLS